jgi:hypothetical protein
MAAGYSTAAVSMGHLALKRAIRHARGSSPGAPRLGRQQAGERDAAGGAWQDTGLVVTNHLGAALDAANVRKMTARFPRLADGARSAPE